MDRFLRRRFDKIAGPTHDSTAFTQMPLKVVAGEPRTREHLQRHPFGKRPVLDHDGTRILETSAITRYLNDVLRGPSLVPTTVKDRARMDMIVGIIDAYAFGALASGVAGYYLFPDFVGGENDAMHKAAIENGRKSIELAMQTKGASSFIAGESSLADLYLAANSSHVALTPDADLVFNVGGFADWWARMQALPSYQATRPNLG